MLVSAAEKAGADAGEAEAFLASKEGMPEIQVCSNPGQYF